MIKKTIDGFETTVDPSIEQAAIDQGIRPVGYDSPITDPCCADKCKAFLDGSYRRGQIETVEKVLKVIRQRSEEREQLRGEDWGDGGDWDNGYLCALESIEHEVLAMTGEGNDRPEGND